MGFMLLPLAAIGRLDDAAVALHLFEEARVGNVPPGLPPGFEGVERVPRLLAAVFLDSLMGVGRLLKRFAELDGQPGVADASVAYFAAFPDLEDLRDSLEHEDERMLFRARRKPIPVPSITLSDGESRDLDETDVFHAPSLSGITFQATVQDGRLAKLEVSQTTLNIARVRTQSVFDATGRTATGYDWPLSASHA